MIQNRNNKEHLKKAIAIKYDPSMYAPLVTAKGVGIIAERILAKAEDSDVQTVKNSELAEELLNIDIGANIPPELYEVVAQVLIFVSDLDKKQSYAKSHGGL